MKKKGFTLIEVMIVLLVFSIGVIAVLKLILYNMNTMSELETKTTATLLAKEGLELAYNTRDSNRLAALPRNCIVNTAYDGNTETEVCKNYFLDNKGLRTIETNQDNIERKTLSSDKILEDAKLYLNNNESTSYTHKIGDQSSIFSRYILFTEVKDEEKIINTGYLLKIESHVGYQRGSKTGEILLEGFIGNY